MKIILTVLSIIIVSLLLAYIYPIAVLIVTNQHITKSLFLEQYYVKTTSSVDENDILREYMKKKGWKEIEQLGSLHIFEKNGLKKEIFNNQVKTIIKDGMLNLQ